MRRSRIALMLATALALVPALEWAWSAGPRVLTWAGLASFAGFAAAGLLAVSMLSMLRLSWLDRAFAGLGQVLQAHHALGLAGLSWLLIHPLALAVDALLLAPSEAIDLLWPNPASVVVLSGWLALLLFVGLFLATVAPRLRFDWWRRLHRASALAYGCMAWHLIAVWTGSVAAGLALAFVAAGAFGYAHRLLGQDPLHGGLHYRVVEVRHRGPELVELVLEPRGQPLRFEAGQFVYVLMRDSEEYRTCGQAHPFTPTGHPDDPQLQLSIKALGDCTRHIQALRPGVEAIVQGPFGGLFPPSAGRRPQVWIAGGVGVTPFLSRARIVESGDPPIDLIYAAPTERAAMYLNDLRELAEARPNLRVHTIFDDVDGLPTVAAVEQRVGALADKEFMLAGPPEMIRSFRRGLRAHGVPASQIHSEEGVLR